MYHRIRTNESSTKLMQISEQMKLLVYAKKIYSLTYELIICTNLKIFISVGYSARLLKIIDCFENLRFFKRNNKIHDPLTSITFISLFGFNVI
jgi:hypothetical protein